MNGTPDSVASGGLNETAGKQAGKEDPGGTGGSSGGGTIAGTGQPSGGTLDRSGGSAASAPDDHIAENAGVAAGADSLAAQAGDETASEAAAFGEADGSIVDALAPDAASPPGPVGAEALGGGAGRDEVGSGTAEEHGELGGGDPLSRPGGIGPADAGSG